MTAGNLDEVECSVVNTIDTLDETGLFPADIGYYDVSKSIVVTKDPAKSSC